MDIYGFVILFIVWLVVFFLALKSLTGKNLDGYLEKLALKKKLPSKSKSQVVGQLEKTMMQISETSADFDLEVKDFIAQMAHPDGDGDSSKVLSKLSDRISKHQLELYELNKKIYELSRYH